MMREEGLSPHWTCMARISGVDYGFLKVPRDNGCWSIAFGIESGDKAILFRPSQLLRLLVFSFGKNRASRRDRPRAVARVLFPRVRALLAPA